MEKFQTVKNEAITVHCWSLSILNTENYSAMLVGERKRKMKNGILYLLQNWCPTAMMIFWYSLERNLLMENPATKKCYKEDKKPDKNNQNYY